MKWLLRIFGGGILLLAALAAGFILLNRVPDRPVEALKARWGATPSQFVELAGMSVHLRDEGPREDPLPLVLLHGTGASLHTWDGWADALRDQRRVVRFDQRGFGLTGPSPDGRYAIEDYAGDVVAVLDHLGIGQAVLAGNSLGGYVAWATTVLHPDRVAKLVLVDAGGYPYQSESVPLGFRIARTPVLNRLMKDVLPRGVIESSLRNVYGDPAKVTPELVDRYFDLTAREGNRGALAARFAQTQPGALAARVPEIRVPTLILWGGRDRLIPPAQGDRFHAEIAGSELALFEDLGHVPQEEDPARTVEVVKAFLARL